MTSCVVMIQCILIAVVLILFPVSLKADSSNGRLAAYYDQKLVLCDTRVFQWTGTTTPKLVAQNIRQLGVGRDAAYGLNLNGNLLTWQKGSARKLQIFTEVKWFAAGRSGVFVIRNDNSLWFLERSQHWFREGDVASPLKISENVKTASIGDSANYYVTLSNKLFVKGLAHRGQYGNGNLEPTEDFVEVAQNVVSVKSHTGHAIYLATNGDVMGAGGNIYGPLGTHGLGDKAIRWGIIFNRATAIATGSSHTLALRPDDTLWQWGRDIGMEPAEILKNVSAFAADRQGSIALSQNNALWQWARGESPEIFFRCPTGS